MHELGFSSHFWGAKEFVNVSLLRGVEFGMNVGH